MKWKKITAFVTAVLFLSTAMLGCQNSNQTVNQVNNGQAGNTGQAGSNGQAGNSQSPSDDAEADTEQNQGKGRFIESEIELPKEIAYLIAAEKLADGTLAAVGKYIGNDSYYLLHSNDEGAVWDLVPVADMQSSYIYSASIAPDGTTAFIGIYEDSDIVTIKLVNADGSLIPFQLSLPELSGDNIKNQVREVKYDADGNLLILDFAKKIYRVDVSSGTCTALCDTGSQEMEYFGIAGNTLLAVVPQTEIQLFSSTDGSAKEPDSVLNELAAATPGGFETVGYYPIVFSAGEEEGSYIYATHDGVYYHSANGSVSEQLINGELTSLGDTSQILASVTQIDEKTYMVMLGGSLLKYTYDENASAVPEKQLNVYALEDSIVLQQAISIYQKHNPDVFVKREIGMSGKDGITAEDALQALSTQILAGKGPDVLILDGMPMDSYVEKGILSDISSVIEEIDSADGIFSNIKSMYQNDGKIYYFPTRFFLSMIEGSADAVAAGGSIETLLSYAKEQKQKNPEQGIIYSAGAKGLLLEMMEVDAPNWRNADGSIDKTKLEQFLSCIKEMYELDSYEEDQLRSYAYEEKDYGREERMGSIAWSANDRLSNLYQIAFGTMGDMYDYADILAVDKETSSTFDLLNGKESKVLQPYLLAGVTENSKEKEGAINFIRTLLGSECGSISHNGFSVNRAAFKARYENQQDNYLGFSGANGEYTSLDVLKPNEQEYNQLVQIVESLDTVAVTDRIIRELILEEGLSYILGEASLDEAVTHIMQKVNLYLSE